MTSNTQQNHPTIAFGSGVQSGDNLNQIIDDNGSTSQPAERTNTKMILGSNNSANWSLKTNNLKYHLMRDLLQKKTLEEIIQLKQRLIHTAKIADQEKRKSGKKGGIKFPGAKFTATTSTNNPPIPNNLSPGGRSSS